MQVQKRNGEFEQISFDKITKRIIDLAFGLKNVEPILIAKETINGIYDRIKTTELDTLSAEICATKSQVHPDYSQLGGRILVSNIIKTTSDSYLEVVSTLHKFNIVSSEFYEFVKTNEKELQEMFDYQRDYLFDFFAMKTLERSYLFKYSDKIIERPQHMWMRVAIQIHAFVESNVDKLTRIKETYDLISRLYFTHATPTLFNSGTKNSQLSSCFLLSSEDNLEDIFKTISDIAKISKWAGGIGLSLSNIRSKGTLIKGTNGKSEGIIPLCKTLETVGRYINQGGKRQGSIAVFLEPWHSDIYAFIELRKNTGDENLRARDLFIALWVPDLFMRRVERDEDWTLMCPDECRGLVDSYGADFEKLYEEYESKNMGKRKIRARDLWNHILENQIETGMPYISYKDTVNHRNMQKQLGVIRNSNLCVAPETMLLTSTGYYPIKTFEDGYVNVWNGEEFTRTIVRKTSDNELLIKVVLSNGLELECTPHHHFYIQTGTQENATKIAARDLEHGMKLLTCNFPVIKEGYNIYVSHIFSPTYVPINGSLSMKLKWLDEVFAKNGTTISSSDYDFLKRIALLLETVGCGNFLIKKTMNEFHKLIISDSDISILKDLGLKYANENGNENANENANENKPLTVEKIIHTGRLSPTYCFTEEKRGMGVFNGILTGQCNEIALFSNRDNTAVCNLASICLPKFVKEDNSFDFEMLQYVAGVVTRNLNNVIDVNFYPTPETRKTNTENRPIGIGIQGLADVYCMMGLPFGSEEARALNRQIFETIYYGSVKMSIELAKIAGPYENFRDSPHSNGLLQFDLYEDDKKDKIVFTLDWGKVKTDLRQYGIRNSLLTALMPTASTSQIMGNNECFEPYTSNLYVRKTLAGEFTVVNQHLIRDLTRLGLWNTKIYEEILFDNGSVQNISSIPESIKQIYKTAFEVKITDILKQAVERSPFVDHMQSMNLFMKKPDFNLLNSSHFYSWKNGLKTGMYYLRTQPAVDAIKFGLDPTAIHRIKDERKDERKKKGLSTETTGIAALPNSCENCSA
jgi:ribonucleotide reductase alpha subunit